MTGENKIIHQDLIEGCRNHDRKAQVRIYELYYKAMYNTSYRILKNEAEAEDIMQEAFLDAFRKIDSFKGTGSFGSWLKKIVVNRSLDKLRTRKEMESLDEKEVEIEDAPETDDSYAGNVFNRLEDVSRAMEALPDRYRVILSLYLLEGYDHEEIAEILNISYNNARTRYARAKQSLLKEIGRQREKLINPINN